MSLAALLCLLMAVDVASSYDFQPVVEGGSVPIVFGNEREESDLHAKDGRLRGCNWKISRNSMERRNLVQESDKLGLESVILPGNRTILSTNRTFELGFFNTNSNWYLGIWYASIPIKTYVWVANRENPVKNISSASVRLTDAGQLAVTDSDGVPVWQTENGERAASVRLLEAGNLILFSPEGKPVWQSFDFPADTWLPGMNITTRQQVTSWKSASDPSPGNYSLRLKPPEYGAFELVYNGSQMYWSTGNWTGSFFTGVPEMTVPYIYAFHFENPFTPEAHFVYTVTISPMAVNDWPPLTRFSVDSSGQLKQHTWSPQTENWDMFWSKPDNICRVYSLCGNFGICKGGSRSVSPCDCLAGFRPSDLAGWRSGDFSAGCIRQSLDPCSEKTDGFLEVGAVYFTGADSVSVSGSRRFCEESCLKNCSCFGFNYYPNSGQCQNLYGDLLNLRNLTSDTAAGESPVLYVRVGEGIASPKGPAWRTAVLVGCFGAVVLLLAVLALVVLMRKKKKRKRQKEEESIFPVTNLKIFTHKELHAASRGFSDKLGHGGFGTVFRGELLDSTPVAIKRLERPGGAEREFRAEVCTIGNIQHVNLVRLRGFCSENSHRLLVYDYMPNGPLSVFLRKDGPSLSWNVRFLVAVGTARGIAYLHEECRDCIIHCDIKPENILLDGEFSAKVSDFGLAKLVGRDFSRVMTTMRGTWGYVAPEWISGVAITAKADVYSYGMTLLEIIGGRRNIEAPPPSGTRQAMEVPPNVVASPLGSSPISSPRLAPPQNVKMDHSPPTSEVPPSVGTESNVEAIPAAPVPPMVDDEKWFFPPWAARKIIEGDLGSVVDPRLEGDYDIAEASRVALVAVWCIQDEEGARPTMGTVVKMLEGTVDVGVPPTPQLLQALVSGDSFPSRGIVSGLRSSPSIGRDRSTFSPVSGEMSQGS